eukprot:scaffold7617_cov74-Skeletonema_marinoi.AAC.1
MKIIFFAPFFVALTSADISRNRVRPHQTSSKAAKSSASPTSSLLEPFEVNDVGFTVEGISKSELSQLVKNKEQFEMLLSDFVEQFYNNEDEGQCNDDFRNSIFNVTANITTTIVEVDPPPTDGNERSLLVGELMVLIGPKALFQAASVSPGYYSIPSESVVKRQQRMLENPLFGSVIKNGKAVTLRSLLLSQLAPSVAQIPDSPTMKVTMIELPSVVKAT